MATSSIFESVRITDQKTAERFVAALEASERDKLSGKLDVDYDSYEQHRLRDPEEIRRFFKKHLEKKNAK